jgi:hypothetical protein
MCVSQFYNQAPLERHILSTTNIGVKAGGAVYRNSAPSPLIIFNTSQ